MQKSLTQIAEEIAQERFKREKLEKLVSTIADSLFEKVRLAIRESLVKGEKGDPGKTPIAGIDFPTPKNGKDGKDGRDGIGIPGQKGDKGDSGLNGFLQTGKETVAKINMLATTPELQIDAKHIKNFPEFIKGRKTLHRGGIVLIANEIPTGAVNGSNTTFTLVNTPKGDTERVFVNGARQLPGSGNDYTISGATITMATAPPTGSNIIVDYERT